MNRRWRIAFLLALSLAAFTLFLNGPDIVTSHEARVALPARQMADSGWPWAAQKVLVPPVILRPGVVRLAPDWDAPPIPVNPWLVPVMSGQIRLQKPPLPYWCAAICFRLSGGFSETAVRLVPALLGALAALLIYDLGRVLYGRHVGWFAGLVWVSTYCLPDEYRKAMADPYLAFFTLACVWSWVRACLGGAGEGRGDAGTRGRGVGETGGQGDRETRRQGDKAIKGRQVTERRGRSEDAGDSSAEPEQNTASISLSPCLPVPVSPHIPASPRPRVSASSSSLPASAFLLLFYLCFAFALLGKGPPAFVDILLPLAVFHGLTRRRAPGTLLTHAVGLVFLLVIALPWPVYVWTNVPHAMELWRYESVGELTDNTENARPGWFYLPQLLFLSLPWTLLLGLGIARQIVRARDRFDAWMRRRLLGAAAPVRPGIDVSAGSESPLAASQRGTENFTAEPQAESPAQRHDAIHFFPLLWFALMVIFFSFVHLKKNQYLLPALPAEALLIAQGFAVVLAGVRRRGFTGAPGVLIVAQTIIGIVFAIAIFALLFQSGHVNGSAIGLSVLAMAAALLPLWAIRRQSAVAWPMVQAIAFVVLILVFGRVYFTPHEGDRSPKPVAAELLELSTQPGHTLLTMRLPEEVAVYLPIDLHYDFRAKHVLIILDDQHGVHVREKLKNAAIPIPDLGVPDARVKEIRQVPLKSAPGDARWKVWELTVDRSIFTRAEDFSPRRHEDTKSISKVSASLQLGD